ncbi:Cro/CI family transcriptional regulator [Pseudomonas asplenii]
MSQGALSKAIREGRSIFVLEQGDGRISAVEERPFPSQRREHSAAQHPNSNPAENGLPATETPVDSYSGSLGCMDEQHH